ncbi:MAG: exodeoxyribonuclease III [Armatimonadota bacterium]|nr:exodeoxyribonuclease III [Armatimonadota bacterium]
MRIATFNANSIRSRLSLILDWMSSSGCDVLAVQETKVADDEFPAAEICQAGYHVVFTGQKAYNGVAILSKEPLEDVRKGLGKMPEDEEARVIRGRFRGVTVVNTYVPQGTAVDSPRFEYKIKWIRGMRDYFDREFTPNDMLLWVGDFNVAPEPIDVYDPEGLYGSVCFHPEEHKALEYVKEWGFVDVFRKHHPGEPGHYTFWDYRIPNSFKRRMGWRLDHIWATRPMAERSVNCWIDTEPRTREKPSDHTFVVADFDLG